jgi:nitrite reductase/ring-hydroxylating ferredoxin subunit
MLTALQMAEKSSAALVQEEAKDFRVHACLYTDPLLYEQEMRQIFEQSWVYIGHASEVAHAGDYRTGRIGTQPIILTRSQDGGINVLLNVCRHRANAICREERGNSLNFQCPYHAWVYTNTGTLLGIPGREWGGWIPCRLCACVCLCHFCSLRHQPVRTAAAHQAGWSDQRVPRGPWWSEMRIQNGTRPIFCPRGPYHDETLRQTPRH